MFFDLSHLPGKATWNNGTVCSSVYVNSSGTYWAKYTFPCSNITYADSIKITFIDCDTIKDPPCNLELEMPNVFSPNNDGVNDYFKPVVWDCVKHPKFLIYNRWGQIVYEANNSLIKWDGKFNGEKCSDGAYFWILTYQDRNIEVSKKGVLTMF
jgi:gliding motility-associated-like protein